jgi:hypothetical protein
MKVLLMTPKWLAKPLAKMLAKAMLLIVKVDGESPSLVLDY